ncbi:type II toxin-antitoxin system RelB/DinJ family antitoxin [Enterococcus sp. 669A]|uniref:Type II toxin-antitoxin system RelB/DinJ family antitoxin n=1 Tax=Candidatus Enterococcus moelleringii TaxID=2815325 RepID=A0ABS3LGL5_9ENTE|nr:type II toxin-antitoxin system RelB/DinJ family antitoxin [Enterococcus sp. 669A]MBO1307846.1 type II toxin-antitoxin system RelB/DinJ family antitoxin [Enterococcus sp. 669A]
MGEINIGIDDQLKEEANKVFDDLGIDMTTAITFFLKQTVKEQRLPVQPDFEPVANILARQEALSGKGRTFDSVEE